LRSKNFCFIKNIFRTVCNEKENGICNLQSYIMKIKEVVILLTFLFVFIHSLPAQNQKSDSKSSRKSEYNGINVSNSNWIHKNVLDARIEWVFKNDSTFIRTKIWRKMDLNMMLESI